MTEELIEGAVWERVYLNDGVQIFPINEKGEIYLIEEKRPHERYPTRLKFVTGLMDQSDEDPLITANREMQEEIGFRADHLELLNHRISSGTLNNNFYQVIATKLHVSKLPNPDGEDTIVSIKAYSVEEILKLIEQTKLPWDMGALAILRIKDKLSHNLIPL